MAQRLTAYETLVMPDYGGFDLYDADCDAHDDDTLIPRARAQVAAGNGYEILVVCAQSRIKVRLHIETWTAQPALPDEWEGHCDLRMEFPTMADGVAARPAACRLPGEAFRVSPCLGVQGDRVGSSSCEVRRGGRSAGARSEQCQALAVGVRDDGPGPVGEAVEAVGTGSGGHGRGCLGQPRAH
ncbi:hypothetical protein ACFXOD_33665 [Streptomyces sp. NPDC059161]|uniref:hypothetical protein n=1 Tax=Streptomyces sp. NPDC059161 TaxID=3346749 RepID=UPI00367693B1